MKTVPLHGKKAAGRVALIDNEDYELVSQHRWFIDELTRPGRDSGPYAQANIRHPDGRHTTIRMHKLITGWPQTDHINHDGLDNRRANLRPATGSQNLANQRTQDGRTSSFKGVWWRSDTRKWAAMIKVNGHKRHLGDFAAEDDAACAYDVAALAAWGEYAHLNFPKEST
jgi:AP2 domain